MFIASLGGSNVSILGITSSPLQRPGRVLRAVPLPGAKPHSAERTLGAACTTGGELSHGPMPH